MLQQRYDQTIEQKWQKYWEENKTYKFDENDNKKEIYSIDTPPPFTSGELHMGHVLSYSFFDFAARYKRMQGFNVYYPQGWDTQGFPTEVKVEKKYGRLPPVQFREKCVEWTKEMIARMKMQMNQMGFSPDWQYEYRTMDQEYHRKVQLSLIKMYNDKLVYRDKYPVYWCPKCVSAIAKAELDDEEKDGNLHHIKFTGPNNEELIIATTRPELLSACEAVLYHPEDERYKGLKGKITTPLGKTVPILADKDVDKEFGSGLVMVCTFGDKMDVVWMHRHKLPLYQAIDQYGKMINSASLNGLKVNDAKTKILEELKEKIVKKTSVKQTVKVHDRCKTPVELIPSVQWFADIRTTAKKIKDMAHKIEWVPDFGISYLIDWVEGAEWDWVISRQRVFGTPLPFYGCECGKTAPADELPFYPEKAKEKKCECGKIMKAETSTCDCWVDSSISPLIISGWPDENRMKKFYPISLRPQGVEIVRTWAFYTIYRSGVALTGIPPFKTILLNGNVLAPDGKKMSKSLGNIISPSDLLKDYPTDAIRQWSALSGAMAKDRPFSFEDIKYAKSFLSKIWNAARFFETVVKEQITEQPKLTKVDKWILGKLNTLIKECTENMEKFEYHYAMSKIQRFFWQDFCDNYVEYVKHRVYLEGPTKNAAFYTLRKVLIESLKLMAPFTPHISEEVYNNLFSKETIHKQKWPEAGEEYKEEVAMVNVLSEVVSQLRQYKSKNKFAQNTELNLVRISLPEEMDGELVDELAKISKIKKVEVIKGEFSVTVE
ncbi:Isoleucine--tRNA ligase [Candidatus Bilamarchaeum dharawalense]|uniref:Valine--tRNA ligase n=1 Tax=Candidatus Bilamarchaeum dharawalense TaxID=2885759 RepID=A0A5E4LSC8_9ARCH|nr:Isoleucine--tRNA ligase [Candidatus Bilamarchaeum dharawalense]